VEDDDKHEVDGYTSTQPVRAVGQPSACLICRRLTRPSRQS
jgi:hypothetical protein